MKTLQEASPTINKVTALESPNNKRLAVVTVDRAVHMYDDNGVRRDKFATKPAEKGVKTYLVRSLAFSPDSTKLAVAQSDNIVFIYKLGLEWGDKKSICNKFPQSNPVTCLAWPRSHPNKVVFGMSDGKVKVGQLKNNKYQTLFNSESYVVSIAPSPDGHGVVTGHIDGSLYLFYFEDASGVPSHRKLCQHSSPPYALGWGESIVAAGTDQRVVFYDLHGDSAKIFDYSMKAKDDAEADVREFTCAAVNPSGETIVLGNYNKFFTYNFSARQSTWNQIGVKSIENLYSVTAATWKPDGSRLTIGNLCGAVDIFDACIKRMNYKGQFEFTYVSPSNVIVKRLSGENAGHRIVLKSHFGCEIVKINVFQSRYLVAITPETLLMGDLLTCKLSEVQWHMGGSDSDFAASFFKSHKFSFDNEQVGMVFHAGELTLIEYGRNEILGAVRTEATKPSVISVRINERPPPRSERASHTNSDGEIENKKIAFLLDVHTVRVLDLGSGVGIATVNHDTRIDWLELNERGNMLLFRDKRRQLHLYDVIQQNRSTLLSYCNYVQWVPASDVVVAQNRNNLCVWYNINAPDKVTMYQIRGDVEEIERSGGKTEVIVDEGINTASYMLDEALIGFSTAVEDENFEAAMDTLDGLDLTPETEAMWQQLAELALGEGNLPTAERCYAALGDIAKARYIRQVRKIAEGVSAKSGNPDDGMNHWVVRGKLAQLRGDYIAVSTCSSFPHLSRLYFDVQRIIDSLTHLFHSLSLSFSLSLSR